MVTVAFQAFMFLVGVLWCRRLIRRWRDDFVELYEPSSSAGKWKVIGLWSLTIPIIFMTVGAGQHLFTDLLG